MIIISSLPNHKSQKLYSNCTNSPHDNRHRCFFSSPVYTVFCSFYCYNGLLRERQFELLGYAVGMTIILLSVIINYCMVGREDDYTKLVSCANNKQTTVMIPASVVVNVNDMGDVFALAHTGIV